MKEEKLEFNFVAAVSHNKVEDDGKIEYELRPFKVVETLVTKSMRIKDVKQHMLETMNEPGVRLADLVVANQK